MSSLAVLALFATGAYWIVRFTRWTTGLVETSQLVLLLIGIAGLLAAAQAASKGGRALAREQARQCRGKAYQQLLQALRATCHSNGASDAVELHSDSEELANCELQFALWAPPEVARRYGQVRSAAAADHAAGLAALLAQMRKDLGQTAMQPEDLSALAESLVGTAPLYPLRARETTDPPKNPRRI